MWNWNWSDLNLNCSIRILRISCLPQPTGLLEWPCFQDGRRAWARAVYDGWCISLCHGRCAGGFRRRRAAFCVRARGARRHSVGGYAVTRPVPACSCPLTFRLSEVRRNTLSLWPLFLLDWPFHSLFYWSVRGKDLTAFPLHGFPSKSFLEVRLVRKKKILFRFRMLHIDSFIQSITLVWIYRCKGIFQSNGFEKVISKNDCARMLFRTYHSWCISMKER